MGRDIGQKGNVINLLNSFRNNKHLIKQLTIREVSSRYRGSYLGILWSFIIPLLMLIVYTFVFSVVFKARWNTGSDNKIEFALIIFTGMLVFNLFSEVIGRSPSLILNNVNYVKKIIFPLEILPIVVLISALIHMGINLIVLMLGLLIFMGGFHITIITLPLIILPIILFTTGVSWFLTSLGVYLRDLGHIVGVVITALMYMTPIFYSITSIPEKIRFLFYLNPLSYVVNDMRNIMIFGQWPDWLWLCIGTGISSIVFFLGYVWFQKTRGGFADVL